jgi:hypothetical protein
MDIATNFLISFSMIGRPNEMEEVKPPYPNAVHNSGTLGEQVEPKQYMKKLQKLYSVLL